MDRARAKAAKPRGESPFAERFALFAECLLTGVWIMVAALPLVTYPAAFAAGSRHLRRRTAHVGGGLREFLADKRRQADEDESIPDAGAAPGDSADAQTEGGEQGRARKRGGADTLRKAVVQVEHKGRAARLILDRRPPAEGWAWLRYEDDGMEREAELAQVKLVALMEGGRGEG